MNNCILSKKLELERCPLCGVNRPNLGMLTEASTDDHFERNPRLWRFYVCANCGGVVTACAKAQGQVVEQYFPEVPEIDQTVPEKPRAILQQAIETVHAPSGSVMLSASAVDAMLKIKGYRQGTLYERIEQAAKDHLITEDMAKWAHEVRLDANDQRHADESAALPNGEDAKRCVEFAQALAHFLFVLPERVKRGIKRATEKTGGEKGKKK